MVRSHLALLALALLGCGHSDEAPPDPHAAVSPTPATTTETPEAPEAPPTAAEPAPTTPEPAPTPAVGGDVGHLGWAERERRTFVLQAAARGAVTALGIARGGTHVAVGSDSGFVTMLDSATGEVRASERIARSSQAGFELDVIGDVALVHWWGYDDGGLELWRWRDGTRVNVAVVNDELQLADPRVALSPRGDRFVLANDGSIHLGSARNGRLTTTVEGRHLGRLSWPHARAIVEVVDDGFASRALVRVIDPQTLAELWTAPADAVAIVRPAGDRVVLLDGPDVVVRALPGGEERARVPHGLAGADRIVVSREGDRVAVSSSTTSAMIVLAGGARTEIPGGRALWVSPRNVLLEAEDGSVRRWVLEQARLGARVAPARAVAGSEDEVEPSNLVEIDPAGTVAFARGDHVEIVQPSGARHEFAHGGEHSAWAVSVDPARGGLAIGGRFGVQGWRATGVSDSSCAGATSGLIVAWPEGSVVSDGECDLVTGARASRPAHDPFVVSADGRFLVERDGSFRDRASGRRVHLEGQTELFCVEGDNCSGIGAIGAGGTAVFLQLYYGNEDALLVHETAGGRRIATLPFDAAYAVAPDGAWLAHASSRSLGWLDLVGASHTARSLVGSGADEEATEQARIVLAPSPDGRSIAWTPGNGHSVQVVSVADGDETSRITVGARVLELRWSASGTQLAIRTEQQIRIQDVGATEPARTLAAAHGTLEIACSEHVLRWIRDASAGGLEVIDLGACGRPEQRLPRLAPGGQLVWTDEGIVRVRRLEGGEELTLRTVREDAARSHHLAHDAEGHWWTDEPATEAAPVPTWVRHGDGRGGETTPLDPAMREDDLLARFFAAR